MKEATLISNWKLLIGNLANYIDERELLKVQKILQDPHLENNLEDGYIGKLIPYFIQKIKMWGIHVLEPENIYNLITRSSVSKSYDHKKQKLKFDKEVGNNESKLQEAKSLPSKPLTRTDIVSSLVAVISTTVLQDVLRLMALFPVALPFIVQDMASDIL